MLCIQCKKRAHFYSFACGHPVFSALFIEETIVFPLSILDTFFKRSISFYVWAPWASQVALVVKNPTANTGDVRDMGLIPALGRSPGGGHDNPLQYSCLENPMDREARPAKVYRLTKSQTWLKQRSTQARTDQNIASSQSFIFIFLFVCFVVREML